MVAKERTDSIRLRLVELGSHILVEDMAEALEEAVHRPDPVALEGAPDLAYVAIFRIRKLRHRRSEG